jgi:hypothetical protein
MTKSQRRLLIVVTTGLFAGFAGWLWYESRLVPLVPILAEGPDSLWTGHPEMLTPKFNQTFCEVSASYGLNVVTDTNGSPMISRSFSRNHEMIWNLTTKTLGQIAASRSEDSR